jgi:hypothetical protein
MQNSTRAAHGHHQPGGRSPRDRDSLRYQGRPRGRLHTSNPCSKGKLQQVREDCARPACAPVDDMERSPAAMASYGSAGQEDFDQGLLACILASMSDACSLVTPACRRCAAGRGIFNECLDMGGVGFSMTKNQYPLVGCVNCAGNCSLKEY